MKVLFIGGTGNISSACSEIAVQRGIELYLLNRGNSLRPPAAGAKLIYADIRQPESVRAALGELSFDAVVDWVAYTPGHVQNDVELFRGRTGQYIFISSASAYHTQPLFLPVTESTPLHNPFWQYSRDKAACEALLWDAYTGEGFPATVVRPRTPMIKHCSHSTAAIPAWRACGLGRRWLSTVTGHLCGR